MEKQTFATKSTGDALQASEWNQLTSYTNSIVDELNNSSGGSGPVSVSDDTESGGDPAAGVSVASGVSQIGSAKVIELTKKKKGVNTTLVSGNNINIEPRESVDTTKGGNISLKPGDDIEFCSHHRLAENQDEVSIKVIDGNDDPVKLQINLNSLTLTTKDSTLTSPEVLDVNINSNKNTKGYLKVRAQAIDLRCEEHGGIALQPKGEDSQHYMNKIKFEHGGGDGLEFGTFNTEKTSIFTDEYRFNKNGVWKMATRTTQVSDKYDNSDETTHYKYVKQADDFYDIIDPNDRKATTEQIITTAEAFNGTGNRDSNKTISLRLNGHLRIMNGPYFKMIRNPEENLLTGITFPISRNSLPSSIANNAFVLPPITLSFHTPGDIIHISDIVNALSQVSNKSEREQAIADFLHDYETTSFVNGNIYYFICVDGNDQVTEGMALKRICSSTGDKIDIISPNLYLNGVNADDIKTVVEYFKTNNTTGPFANL